MVHGLGRVCLNPVLTGGGLGDCVQGAVKRQDDVVCMDGPYILQLRQVGNSPFQHTVALIIAETLI